MDIMDLQDFMLPIFSFISAIIGGAITTYLGNKLQNNREITQFRYKMLCELSKEFVTLPRQQYTIEDIKKASNALYYKASHNFEIVEKIYWQLIPLVIKNNTKVLNDLKKSYEEIITKRNIINDILQKNNGRLSNEDNDINFGEYLKKLDRFYYEMRNFIANYAIIIFHK
jgi:hypothetical protein